METRFLSFKQRVQFIRFVERTGSPIQRDKLPLLELMELSCIYCTQIRLMDSGGYKEPLKVKLSKFNAKYYPFGYKPGKPFYPHISIDNIMDYPRFTVGLSRGGYKPIEKIAFIMCSRACYKYLIQKIDADSFIEKLEQIRTIVY